MRDLCYWGTKGIFSIDTNLTPAQERLLRTAEHLRQELDDDRFSDEAGEPLKTVLTALPSVEFVDAEARCRVLLEEASGSRWLLQFFDTDGGLLGNRSGRLPPT